jgi:hypothetical protein
MIEITTNEQISTILSKGKYWEEVLKRSDITPLNRELVELVSEFGIRLLFLVLEGAKAIKLDRENLGL